MLADALGKLTENLKAPTWLVDEGQQRLVLFLNHVLMQEPEAQARLARQKGRVVRLQWRDFSMQLAATPAGLWELAPAATPDLLLTVSHSPQRGPLHNNSDPWHWRTFAVDHIALHTSLLGRYLARNN